MAGSIPATGRKGGGSCQNGAVVGGQFVGNAGGSVVSGRSSTPTTPMSAPNSLQFNHLIGGAISPSIVAAQSVQQQQQGLQQAQQQLVQGQQIFTQAPANAHIQHLTHQQPTAQILASNQQMNQTLMIGDYVQGNLNNVVLGNAYRQ